MKNKKRIVGVFCGLLAILCGGVGIAKLDGYSVAKAEGIVLEGVDFSDGGGYTLEGSIMQTPSTFEAWIMLPTDGTTNASGDSYGVIFGNYTNEVARKAINYEIGAYGHPTVYWQGTRHVFDQVSVRTGEWVHLAIVRKVETKQLVCYVNGEAAQTLENVVLKDTDIGVSNFSVGKDSRVTGNYVDALFMGKIQSVALFEEERSEEEIASDISACGDLSGAKGVIYAETYGNVSEEEVVRTEKTYFVQEDFSSAPMSFEATVKLSSSHPDNALGGVIFGNTQDGAFNIPGMLSYEVAKNGHFLVRWNNGEFVYEFRKADLRQDEWVHIALVRDADAGTFTYYVNGEVNEVVASEAEFALNQAPFAIGNDFRNDMQKVAFAGEIKRVALYANSISAAQVNKDMAATVVTDDGKNQLLASWELGDWSSKIVKDASQYGNHLSLGTSGKWLQESDLSQEISEFAYDYSFVVIPDTQNLVDDDYNNYAGLQALTNWIVDNKSTEKIAFAMHLGDFVNTPTINKEWQRAAEQMNALTTAGIPYTIVPGNHDYDNMSKTRALTKFNQTFASYLTSDTLLATYEEGKAENTCHKFTAGGIEYLVFALEFGPRKAVLDWAGEICDANKSCRAIVTTHAYVTPYGEYDNKLCAALPKSYGFAAKEEVNNGDVLFNNFVSKHENIFMVFNGHYASDDIVMRTDYGVAGNRITSMLIDAQSMLAANEGMLAVVKVNETTKQICVNYINPQRNAYYNVQNQFIMSFADVKNPSIGGEKATVTFDGQGATNTMNAVEGTVGGLLVLPKATVYKAGYTLLGWATEANGKVVYTDGEQILPTAAETTLYAVWRKDSAEYTIEYYIQNRNGEGYTLDVGRSENRLSMVGESVSFQPVPDYGYTLNAEKSILSGVVSEDGLVLKVYFDRAPYTVTFIMDGGEVVSGELTQNVLYGGSAVAPTVKKDGYTIYWKDRFNEVTEDITVEGVWVLSEEKLREEMNKIPATDSSESASDSANEGNATEDTGCGSSIGSLLGGMSTVLSVMAVAKATKKKENE